MSFSGFGFLEDINSFLKESKFKEATEVQKKAIPFTLEDQNISVLAQTGTGKTLAYALPLFERIKRNDEDIPMESQVGAPRGIIMTPTRELNTQVTKVLKSVAHHCKLRIRHLIGGDAGKRSRKISEEAYDILVCSPGRLKSALERGEVKADILESLIFDEADQLLDMGFAKDIGSVLSQVKKALKGHYPQIALYSATWPPQYSNFVKETFQGVSFQDVVCQGGVQLKRNIETFNIQLGVKDKKNLLIEFLKSQGKGMGVIFFNKKDELLILGEFVKTNYPRRKFHILHGALSLNERRGAFKEFQEKGGVLLASDIAARGLDIDNLAWILNYDLPFEAVYYVHRCGRTGRAGRTGKVFNFVTPSDLKLIKRINEAIVSQSSLALKPLDVPKNSKRPQESSNIKKRKKATAKTRSKKKIARKNTPRYKKKKR